MLRPEDVAEAVLLCCALPARAVIELLVIAPTRMRDIDADLEIARAARSAGGGAIVRPDSHQRSLLIRYLNVGADGLMVPLVNTADAARHIVETVRYACPAISRTGWSWR